MKDLYIVDGTLEVGWGDRWATIGSGETFEVLRGEDDTLWNPLDREVHWLTGWSPLGLQDWLAEYGIDASEPEAATKSLSGESVRAAGAVAGACHMGAVPKRPDRVRRIASTRSEG